MRFSVLLPTRNRLEYLRYAVESVRRQDWEDWEIIISDNASQEDVAGYVASLGEPRIRYFRTEEFVSVTDNWNIALKHSTGDWVVMLGDDDALMKGYFKKIGALVAELGAPDLVYTSAFLFAYPHVLPDEPEGSLGPYGFATFLLGKTKPYFLSPRRARRLVTHSLNFKARFGFNMQFAAVSRGLIQKLSAEGEFYQSPFPDFFAMNAMFLKATRILVCPLPLVAIGITKRSYGYFHFNRQEADGMKLLNSAPDKESAAVLASVVLSGSNINNGWLFAMEALKNAHGRDGSLKVNYRRYRFVQRFNTLQECYLHKRMSRKDADEQRQQLHIWEQALYGAAELIAYRYGGRLVPATKRAAFVALRAVAPNLPWFAKKVRGKFQNILEVFESGDALS